MPRRTDHNQAEIVKALRDVGATVQDLHLVGHGCPDILVGYRGKNYVMEIKMPTGTLNEAETRWIGDWQGKTHVIRSVDEALLAIGATVYITGGSR
jgi:hypothetical protein